MKDKPPRACFLYYAVFEGNAMLYREAKALQDEGFDIDILAISGDPEKPFRSVFRDMTVYCLQKRKSREKNPLLYFARLGLFILKSFGLLSFLGIKRRYQVILVTAPPDLIVFTALVPKLLGARIILDIHDIGPELFMRKLGSPEDRFFIRSLKCLERLACSFSDHIFTVTAMWRDRLTSRSVPPGKISVLLNVPDQDLFRPLPGGEARRGGPVLSYHGSLEEHFGVDAIIEAMPLIRERLPDARLVLHGAGRMLDALRARAAELRLGEAVALLDPVPFYQLPEILSRVDIGVVPTKGSTFSEETISMKGLEYMAMGIPIVISGTKAHRFYYTPEMVTFFEPGDPADLARAVGELFFDGERRERQRRMCLEFLEQQGWKKQREVFLDRVVPGRSGVKKGPPRP